ncbi:hypothetical protein CANARDRAFT_9371 [[Candida] arabinofermentans NRRL YB-2248]|uniref:Major facilitator superfamily (MFS) profile domain-containing protein n=1 Tax=[Candida] arabinofermentans NRRL YB-2248 TaxID=983967 RepID=A0A1E4SVN9_9ASCO|nr:hypothetical protein CANARDRAFT_9371 [[Candida] arabinofermentans NRRL YB-2248]
MSSAQPGYTSDVANDLASIDSIDQTSSTTDNFENDSESQRAHKPVGITAENNPTTRATDKSTRTSDILNDEETEPIQKSSTNLSRISTIKFDPSKIVPKNKRRGLLANLCLIPEYENPRELPKNVKYLTVLIVAVCAIIGPMGTSILLPATDSVVDELNTTVTIVNISIGIYLITLGVFPLWWSNFSERHGRRSIYVISFILYFAFSIGTSLSTSIGMLIGFRVLAGGSAASVQAVGAGTISDLYAVQERGTAMGIYYLGPLAAPLIAPIVGGAITSKKSWGWRGTQWFLVIMAGFCVLLIVFCLPETLNLQENREAIKKILRERLKKNVPIDEENNLKASSSPNTLNSEEEEVNTPESNIDDDREIDTILERLSRQPSSRDDEDESEYEQVLDPVTPIGRTLSKVSQKQKQNELRKLGSEIDIIRSKKNQTLWQKLRFYGYIYGYSPLKSLNFFRYPPVFLAILYSAPCFAVLYFVNLTLTYCYSRPPYNFSSILVGLVYIPNSVTYIVASIWGGRFNDYLLEQKRKKYGIVAPEARFGINVYIAAAIFPGSLLIIGWCLDKKEHWVTPLVGTAFFGFAQMIVIGVTVTYVADSLPGRGATGIALSNFVRMILAAGSSFATEPLIKAIGVGPLFSILAGVTVFLTVILVVIKKKGDHWRETYDLERIYDIVDGEE